MANGRGPAAGGHCVAAVRMVHRADDARQLRRGSDVGGADAAVHQQLPSFITFL